MSDGSVARPHPSASRVDGRALIVGASVGLLTAVVLLAWRGVSRGLVESRDLAVAYAAGRAWLQGHDPYAASGLARDILSVGGDQNVADWVLLRLLNVYFPMTLPVYAPFAVLDWPTVLLVYLALGTLAAVFIAVGVVRLIRWPLLTPRSIFLMAFVLAMGPMHVTLMLGQTAVLATAAIVAGLLLERSGRPKAAGVAFGLATVIKVQIGLPFLAYLVWRRRWPAAITAGGLVVGLTIVSVAWMQIADTPWATTWLSNLAVTSAPGGLNDAGPANPDNFAMLNLQLPFLVLVSSQAIANVATFVVVGLAALAVVWLARERRDADEFLVVAVVAVLCLLVTYHRYYDAVILALPVAWGFSALGTARKREGIVALALCSIFLLPVLAVIHNPAVLAALPSSVVESLVWQFLVAPVHVWALVLLTVVLLWALAAGRQGAVSSSNSTAAVA